jgi:hypothetical protein
MRREMQDHKFEAILGYRARPCLKTETKTSKQKLRKQQQKDAISRT